MILELTYSGHYPRKFVEITEEENIKLERLTRDYFLFDTMEGQAFLTELEAKPAVTLEFKSVRAVR